HDSSRACMRAVSWAVAANSGSGTASWCRTRPVQWFMSSGASRPGSGDPAVRIQLVNHALTRAPVVLSWSRSCGGRAASTRIACRPGRQAITGRGPRPIAGVGGVPFEAAAHPRPCAAEEPLEFQGRHGLQLLVVAFEVVDEVVVEFDGDFGGLVDRAVLVSRD